MTQDRATRTGLVESPVPGNRPAGFGGRTEETGRSKDRYRVSVRPYNYVIGCGRTRKPRRSNKSEIK